MGENLIVTTVTTVTDCWNGVRMKSGCMPVYAYGDACLYPWRCLVYTHGDAFHTPMGGISYCRARHLHHSFKASPSLVQGIGTTLRVKKNTAVDKDVKSFLYLCTQISKS